MAITYNHIPPNVREEMRYCEERMHRAASRQEFEHFRERLRDLELRVTGSPYYGGPELRHPSLMPTSLGEPREAVPEPITALSFLKSADKKLLLTGATT